MLALLASAKRVSPLGITVLLTGESGTGKEVIARIIHQASGVPDSPFVAFNCATVPRDMVDSQLFGYRRGAFTGAVQGFNGVINAAEGGTLLLDEVGELTLESQPKLLRFLDTGEVQALGEAVPRRSRVRVIAATNADLEALVSEGRFREDLFYRLNVVRFRLPPLRERRGEIVPLIEMLLSRYALQCGKHNISLSEAAMEHLMLYRWPGNVRELSHEIYRLVALGSSDSVIDVIDLDARIKGMSSDLAERAPLGGPTLTIRIDRPLASIAEDVERAAIAYAMEGTDGRLDVVAERLGLSRKGLYLKRQRLGLGVIRSH
jgi:two-component system NtrC family response regulator